MRAICMVHYSEIGTKGGNRRVFERKLAENIRARLRPLGVDKVRLESARVIADMPESASREAVGAALGQVFGVAWYAFGWTVPWGPDPEEPAVESAAFALAREHPEARTFKVFARRAVKHYPYTSVDICRRLGKTLAEKTGMAVDLEGHELAVHVEVLPREVAVFGGRHEGLRGMPRGSSGGMLCLFSGGIDSPVAAWQMMRRGAAVDLLHFHPFRSAAEVKGSKIFTLHNLLRAFHAPARLILIPHDRYQVAASMAVPEAYETVFFRRFMFRAASVLAGRGGWRALITGDCLGQVASQTLENLAAAQAELAVPVFQPLIAMDKDDIVRLAQQIGTFAPSIEPYKDCCSLMARKPKTKVAVGVVRRLENELDMERMISDSLAQAEVWDGETLRPFVLKERPPRGNPGAAPLQKEPS